MSKVALEKLAAAIEALQQQVASLSERLARLEPPAAPAAAPEEPVVAVPEPPAVVTEAESEPVMKATHEEIEPEILLAISAAVAAYLGERAHVRAVRLISTSRWSQEGRVSIQASHHLNRV